jgi:hypothetical protein
MKATPTIRYEPVNACIYCGDSASKLTDEHIIPFSLGGTAILPKASCLQCADVTKKLEGYAGRQIFQDVRVQHGLPTRRPKERPTHFPVRQSFDPTPKEAQFRLVPTKDAPGVLALFNHEPAGILLGRTPNVVGRMQPFIREITDRDRIERLKDLNIAAKVYREIQPDLILRMIAKIALGFAAAAYGLKAFEPTLQNVILRRDTNPYYWVGGTTPEMNEFPRARGPDTLHRVSGYMRQIESVPYLLFQLQLFSYLDAPTYTAVVGKLTQDGMDRFR